MLLLPVIICTISLCSSIEKEEHSYGDECKHCHGDRLQGINNVKDYCGQCHDPLYLKPEDIKVQERREAVFNGAHPHKTDNIFKGTPSCFYCHRRTDF